MRKVSILFDFMGVIVEEYLSLPMCFKCCMFGHVAKHCKSVKDTCYKCGGEHDGRSCDVSMKSYVNCKRVGNEEHNHEARDRNCLIYKRKLEWQKGHINYGP